jgi:hypothetical protein
MAWNLSASCIAMHLDTGGALTLQTSRASLATPMHTTRKHAEEAATFTLACLAEEQGLSAPTKLEFEHYVPVRAPVTA